MGEEVAVTRSTRTGLTRLVSLIILTFSGLAVADYS